MIYIAEGLNKIGKTTFIKKASEKFNIQIVDFKRPDNREEAKAISYFLLQMCKQVRNFPSIIIDRGFPSEIVYNENVDIRYYKNIDLELSMYATIWYLEIPKDILLQRWSEFSINYDMDFQKLKYESFLKSTKLRVVRINPFEEINENIL